MTHTHKKSIKAEKHCLGHRRCLPSSLPFATLASQSGRLRVQCLDISIWCWGWGGGGGGFCCMPMLCDSHRDEQVLSQWVTAKKVAHWGSAALQSCRSWMTALFQNCQQQTVMFMCWWWRGWVGMRVAELMHVGVRKKSEVFSKQL